MLVGNGMVRARRYHKKSLNGCQTCRRKHVKCDELKPVCMRCLLAGSDCEYGPPRAWLFPPATSPQTSELQTLQPSTAFSSPSERRALVWYMEKTLPDITGFTSQTGTFWRSLMPRLSDSEPAIRHILIAVASKHEALGRRSPGTAGYTPLCAKHHSLALQHLVRPQRHVKADVLLMSCVAFSFFERMHDPFAMEGRCSEFIQAGLKILRERRAYPNAGKNKYDSSLIDDFLGPMFCQMELVLTMFHTPDHLIYFDSQGLERSTPKLPAVFEDMRTARHAFFHIIARRYSIVHNGEKWSTSSAGFRHVRNLLAKWLAAFDAYLGLLARSSVVHYDRAFFLREQTCLLIGAILYSARSEIPIDCYCRPIIADLSNPLKISITARIRGGTPVNLSGVNTGTPPKIRDRELCLWPRARCVKANGNEHLILMELNGR